MRKLAGVAITAAALVLGSCSDDRDQAATTTDADSAESTSGQAESSAADESDANEILRAAVVESASSDVIGFTHQLRFGDVTVISTEGSQQFSGSWSATTVTDDPSTPATDHDLDMEARSREGEVWMQMAAWQAPMGGCWLQLEPGDVPVGIYGLQPGEVGYVSILAAMEARHFEDGSDSRIAVDVALRNAQMLFTGQVIDPIELPEAAWTTTRIPATVEIQDGRVHSIEMSGSALTDAVDQAGGTIADKARMALGMADAQVTYPAPVDASVAGPPPADLVVTEDGARQGCH